QEAADGSRGRASRRKDLDDQSARERATATPARHAAQPARRTALARGACYVKFRSYWSVRPAYDLRIAATARKCWASTPFVPLARRSRSAERSPNSGCGAFCRAERPLSARSRALLMTSAASAVMALLRIN